MPTKRYKPKSRMVLTVKRLLQSLENTERQKLVREKLTEEISNSFRYRYVKEFLDLIFLFTIEENGETSAYDFLRYLHQVHDLMVSPSTVYAVAYSMQKDNLIEAKGEKRKTVFSLTPKGRLVIETIRNSDMLLQFCFADLIKGKR
jgi:DNA-binding PadR family transcriptional regulator